MALQRTTLKAMGLNEEQIDSIIDMHIETVNALKAKIPSSPKEKEEQTPAPKDEGKKTGEEDEDYKAKWEKEHSDFESYKSQVENAKSLQAKEKAVRAYFESKNITGKNLEIAMRGAKTEIAAAELDGENLKDTKPFDTLIAGDFAPLVVTTETTGASTATPPAASTSGKYKDKSEILAIKDGAERRQAIAENPGLFGVESFEK